MKNEQLHHFRSPNLLWRSEENQSPRPVTLQKEDNYSGAYAGLIYSQFCMKGFNSLLSQT